MVLSSRSEEMVLAHFVTQPRRREPSASKPLRSGSGLASFPKGRSIFRPAAFLIGPLAREMTFTNLDYRGRYRNGDPLR